MGRDLRIYLSERLFPKRRLLLRYSPGVAGRRRRHQKKEVEQALVEAEGHGFRVEVPTKGYWKLKCPAACADHMWQVHLTPKNAGTYARHLLARLRQCPRWEEGE